MRFKNILNLIRITHWSKNLYIFIPLFFSKELFRIDLIVLIYLFLIFSLAASCVYIFNDINDYKSDKKNKWKKNRPIANGSISIINANIIFFFLLFLLSAVLFVFNSKVLNYIILAYFVSNLLYTNLNIYKF